MGLDQDCSAFIMAQVFRGAQRIVTGRKMFATLYERSLLAQVSD
jgi:hypothetical protein